MEPPLGFLIWLWVLLTSSLVPECSCRFEDILLVNCCFDTVFNSDRLWSTKALFYLGSLNFLMFSKSMLHPLPQRERIDAIWSDRDRIAMVLFNSFIAHCYLLCSYRQCMGGLHPWSKASWTFWNFLASGWPIPDICCQPLFWIGFPESFATATMGYIYILVQPRLSWQFIARMIAFCVCFTILPVWLCIVFLCLACWLHCICNRSKW